MTGAEAAERLDFSRYRRLTLPRDESLFLEEDDSRELYVLLTGRLGVYRNEVQVATIDQPLSLVGEISALTGRPRAATVRAIEVATLIRVDDPEPLFAEHPRLGIKLARVLAARLADMNQRFVELKELMVRFRPAVHADLDRTEPFRLGTASTRPAAAGAGADDEQVLDALSRILDWDPASGELI